MLRRTPLAWHNLTHDKRRLVLSAGGVGFAVLLMFLEVGFLFALLDSTVEVVKLLRGDLIIISRTNFSMVALERFDIRRIYQARSVPGVAAVYPLYMETLGAVLRRCDRTPPNKGFPIRVLAAQANDPVWNFPEVEAALDRLRAPGVALLDRASRAQYDLPHTLPELAQCSAELSEHPLRFVGTFYLGVDFANDGNIIMTADNLADYFPYRARGGDPLSVVDLGIVQKKPGADLAQLRAALEDVLPDDVLVFTRDGFIEREMRFWSTSTPVGYIFLVGAVVGFIVGVIICYQIIYTDINDHMPEFATLKAMGYPRRYFYGLVFSQSIYLSILGFLPGFAGSMVAYRGLAGYTGLTMQFNAWITLAVFIATLCMCALSGLLAVRRLLSADPASLF